MIDVIASLAYAIVSATTKDLLPFERPVYDYRHCSETANIGRVDHATRFGLSETK